MKSKWLRQLFGLEQPEVTPPAFEGTSAELLQLAQQMSDEKQDVEIVPESCDCEAPCPKENMDKVWLNLEFVKLALQIEESKAQRKIFYVDIGNLPKKAAQEYVAALMDKHQDKNGDMWLPRREGGRGTEVTTFPPGGATLEGVLATAKKLKDFASE